MSFNFSLIPRLDRIGPAVGRPLRIPTHRYQGVGVWGILASRSQETSHFPHRSPVIYAIPKEYTNPSPGTRKWLITQPVEIGTEGRVP